jgi:hypothetical protein
MPSDSLIDQSKVILPIQWSGKCPPDDEVVLLMYLMEGEHARSSSCQCFASRATISFLHLEKVCRRLVKALSAQMRTGFRLRTGGLPTLEPLE